MSCYNLFLYLIQFIYSLSSFVFVSFRFIVIKKRMFFSPGYMTSSSEIIPYIIGSLITMALIKWLFSKFLFSITFVL